MDNHKLDIKQILRPNLFPKAPQRLQITGTLQRVAEETSQWIQTSAFIEQLVLLI